MITRNEYQEQPQPVLFSEPLMTPRRRLSGANGRGARWKQAEEFHPEAVGRLYLAIVNRAILDLLENGKESESAERWLLSRDFDRLQEVFD
jgi:hypothetical protein